MTTSSPLNDDAIRAIKLIVGKMADAAIEGMALRQENMDEEVTDVGAYSASFDGMEDVDDEILLGESTLAKMREAAVDTEDDEDLEEYEDLEKDFEEGGED